MTLREKKGRGSKNVFICCAMFLVTIGTIIYAIIRGNILEERYGKHNLFAMTNLYEEFTLAVVLLVAPVLGSFSAFRLARSAKRLETRLIGWLLLTIFLLLFFNASVIQWSQYRSFRYLGAK